MLTDIIDVLADPTDGSSLRIADDGTRIVSDTGHSYDIARSQGARACAIRVMTPR